jgi:hypothetical protein
MLIKELKEQISDMEDNLEVYLQTDPEGNGYRKLSGIDDDAYIMENDRRYRPNLYSLADTEEYDDKFVRVAVVYP